MIYDVDENDYRTPEKDYYDADVKTYKYLTDCIDLFTDLNNEVEIIKEPKKIEKWGEGALEEMEKCTDYTLEDLQKYIRILAETQNELIDEINNLKEKKDE